MRALLLLLVLLVAASLGLLVLSGGDGLAPVYVGGGLPPGEPDIGGIVLRPPVPVEDPDLPLLPLPVVCAQVLLISGDVEVGLTETGPDGYFCFAEPETGEYEVVVTPPPGSGLKQTKRQFRHQEGKQTFLTIMLPRQ